MNSKTDYIAVFDSGVGGISVLRHLLQIMPNERYLYFGDSANAPYGSRSAQQVQQLTIAAVEKLMGYGVKALVIACNTATAAAIEMLRQRYPDTIVIGIEPAVKIAAEHFPKGTIGVLATPVTLSAEKYKQLSQRFENGCQVIPIPAPGLAGLVEEGKINDPETRKLLETLLTPYVGKLDALVLGCTHYPFVKTQICQILGKSVPLYDGGEGTAKETKRRLEAADLLHDGSGTVRLENSIPGEETLQRTMRLLKTGVEDAYE